MIGYFKSQAYKSFLSRPGISTELLYPLDLLVYYRNDQQFEQSGQLRFLIHGYMHKRV